MPINEKFIVTLQGKSFVTYEGLLNLAHENNLKSMDVELVQAPSKENNFTAICRATAVSENGRFTDFGDASPQSVNSKIAPHIIRMASTRAKARALRDLTNIGMTSLEELNLEDVNNDRDEESSPGNISFSSHEPPTKRQLETLQRLANTLNIDIDPESLTKRTAGSLISKMLDEKYKRH